MSEKIFCFNVESEPELQALSRVASSRGEVARIAFRVNPDVDARTHAKIATGESQNKFGVPISRARDVSAYARTLPASSPRRRHAYRLADQDLQPFDDAFALLADFVQALKPTGTQSSMSISAGASASLIATTTIPAPPSNAPGCRERTARSAEGDSRARPRHRRRRRSADPSVLYLKQGENKRFMIVDAAMNDLVRPALYDAHHGILPVKPRAGPAIWAQRCRGPGLRERRFFALGRDLPELDPGDLVTMMSAGACAACRPEPTIPACSFPKCS